MESWQRYPAKPDKLEGILHILDREYERGRAAEAKI